MELVYSAGCKEQTDWMGANNINIKILYPYHSSCNYLGSFSASDLHPESRKTKSPIRRKQTDWMPWMPPRWDLLRWKAKGSSKTAPFESGLRNSAGSGRQPFLLCPGWHMGSSRHCYKSLLLKLLSLPQMFTKPSNIEGSMLYSFSCVIGLYIYIYIHIHIMHTSQYPTCSKSLVSCCPQTKSWKPQG